MIKLLAYSIEEEPITQVLLKHKKKLDLTALCVRDLLHPDTDIFDTFDISETKLHWHIPNIGVIQNTPETFLFNRVCNIPSVWFEAFEEEDQSYSQNEFWAYLMFALNAFPNATEHPGPGALFGSSHSLTAQWSQVNELISSVKTPEFFFGPEKRLPPDWKGETIFSEPYNYYSWKPNTSQEEKKNNVFAIRKPKGFPVVTFYIGDEILIFSQNDEKVTDLQKNFLSKVTRQLYEHFDFFCMEALWFIDKYEIVFAMLNNTPWASQRSPLFEKSVMKEVDKKVEILGFS